jgi:hypothetical protein
LRCDTRSSRRDLTICRLVPTRTSSAIDTPITFCHPHWSVGQGGPPTSCWLSSAGSNRSEGLRTRLPRLRWR